ncbi:hypothetical protein JQX13_05710 [Archangium violaceum]|uniref:hypothetical protein n=1 Tax=Archangium violaceum TaxID=83451 RepID=UPI00193B0E27|nr:hypothetical protein [Archangium violaceum]QRK09628.1 hypothetical protein JQX13_05710 [Archangium violaceum]
MTELSAGGAFSLALLQNGTVWGFGDNSSGQIDDSKQLTYPTPVQRPGLAGVVNVVNISAGPAHVLAVLSDGTARAWGSNVYDQIGDGVSSIHSTPVLVPLV